MHKSTEKSAGELDPTPIIIDSRLSYRIGSPLLPVLPLETVTHPIFPRFAEIWPKITQILQDEHLSITYAGPAKRFRSGQDPSITDHTILVHVDMRLDSHQIQIINAVKDIRKLLTKKGLNYPIEFIDIGAADGMITAIIKDGNLCALWPVMIEHILEEIDGRQWIALDFVLRKMSRGDDEASPTVIITAADADLEEWWNEHLPSIRTKLPQGIDVELLYASTLCIAGSETREQNTDRERHSYITASAYERTVNMGASVALKGSTNDSSTIGCSIRLSAQKDVGDQFGLTNHHVVGDTAQQWYKNGWLAPSHHLSENKSLPTMSPSDYDHQCFQEKLSADIDYYRRALIPDKSGRPKPPGLLDQLEARLNERKSALDSSKADRMFGWVYAASGWRLVENPRYPSETIKKWTTMNKNESNPSTINDGKSLQELIGRQKMLPWYIDWALIEMSPPREMDPYNLVPDSMSNFQGVSATAYIRIDPERTYKVAKVGRTSGRTTGTINRVASVLNLRCDKSSIVPVDLVHRYKNVGLACGVLSSRKDQDFIAGGDSGSVVLLDEEYGDESTAYIVGLGFASNKATMVSYMVPFDLVVRDIEMVTGRRVMEPVWEGDPRGATPDSA